MQAVAFGDGAETAIKQCVGNAGLRLYPVCGFGECSRCRTNIEDDVRLQLQQDFQIGGVASPGEPAKFRARSDLRIKINQFWAAIGARPAQQRPGL
jgi:ferredoxin